MRPLTSSTKAYTARAFVEKLEGLHDIRVVDVGSKRVSHYGGRWESAREVIQALGRTHRTVGDVLSQRFRPPTLKTSREITEDESVSRLQDVVGKHLRRRTIQ